MGHERRARAPAAAGGRTSPSTDVRYARSGGGPRSASGGAAAGNAGSGAATETAIHTARGAVGSTVGATAAVASGGGAMWHFAGGKLNPRLSRIGWPPGAVEAARTSGGTTRTIATSRNTALRVLAAMTCVDRSHLLYAVRRAEATPCGSGRRLYAHPMPMRAAAALAACLLSAACAGGAASAARSQDDRAIRALYDRFASAVRARDAAALMQNFAAGGDLFVFDLTAIGEHQSLDACAAFYRSFLASLPGTIDRVEIRDLGVAADAAIGYSHAVVEIGLTDANGSRSGMTLFLTDGLRKIDGAWRVVQHHLSEAPASAAARQAGLRLAANESSAVMSLRTLNAACVTYAAASGGGFPPNLSAVSHLIDAALASGAKNGYLFTYTPGAAAGGATTTYAIAAAPSPGQTGGRYFFTDQTGVIRASAAGPATASDRPIG